MVCSLRLAAMPRIDGCERSPDLYALSALTMYVGLWPAIFGTWYTFGKAVLYPGMPWQPMHMACAFSTFWDLPVLAGRLSCLAGALSAGGLGCACAPQANAAPMAAMSRSRDICR